MPCLPFAWSQGGKAPGTLEVSEKALRLAFFTGCHVDEGRRHPCVICGLDLGGLLYTPIVMGWPMIPMLPFILLTILDGLRSGIRTLEPYPT